MEVTLHHPALAPCQARGGCCALRVWAAGCPDLIGTCCGAEGRGSATPQWVMEPSPGLLGAVTIFDGELMALVPGEATRAPDNGTQSHFHFLMGELSADGAVNHSSLFPWPGRWAASQNQHSQPRKGGEAWLNLNTNVSHAATALCPAPHARRGLVRAHKCCPRAEAAAALATALGNAK